MSVGGTSKIFEQPANRTAEVRLRLSEFEIPPMQDALLVGRRAPIGPEAARRMVDALSPEQYQILRIDHEVFEAVVIRKILLNLMPQDKLLALLLDEGSRVGTVDSVLRVQVNIEILVSKMVDLS
ncbi:MAG: hypothetical protein ACUVTU_06555 [Desulfurispora sp.]|uniref:hypothetical protein n=1 Tax=Desulfurispora sp. TaxID=3014275 RepID=UPI004049E8F9